MPVFYYRRMRKIGLVESLAYLFVIVTVFQYIINKAAYWEKQFSLSEQVGYQVAVLVLSNVSHHSFFMCWNRAPPTRY